MHISSEIKEDAYQFLDEEYMPKFSVPDVARTRPKSNQTKKDDNNKKDASKLSGSPIPVHYHSPHSKLKEDPDFDKHSTPVFQAKPMIILSEGQRGFCIDQNGK